MADARDARLSAGALAAVVALLGVVGAVLTVFGVSLSQADAGAGRGGWTAPVAGLAVLFLSLLYARTLLRMGRRR